MDYKVFWDKSSNRFTYEAEPEDTSSVSYSFVSATVSVSTLDLAKELVKMRNDRIEAGLLYVHECKDCGTAFMMESDEYDWFIDNDLNPPVRCYKCRQKRKQK